MNTKVEYSYNNKPNQKTNTMVQVVIVDKDNNFVVLCIQYLL